MTLRYMVAIVGLLAFCTVLVLFRTHYSHRDVERYSGSECRNIVKGATFVELYRVDYPRHFYDETIDNMAVLSHGVSLDQDEMNRTKSLVASYLEPVIFAPEKGCPPFQPGVDIRFWNGIASVDIFVCFNCNELLAEKDEHPHLRDFSDHREEFVKLAKTAFPADAKIQALPLTQD